MLVTSLELSPLCPSLKPISPFSALSAYNTARRSLYKKQRVVPTPRGMLKNFLVPDPDAEEASLYEV
jgi:hypothetical protein